MTAQNIQGKPRLGVLGAGGFTGARLVELAKADGRFTPVPILRSYKGLARLRGEVDSALVVDTSNGTALASALKGFDAVVNLTNGDLLRIVEDTQLIRGACLQAGVRRWIHLSSAVVFGRALDPLIDDDSPPDVRSWMLYARGKAKAEVWLRSLGTSPLQTLVLRPGLIWGPGSHWSKMVGDQLLRDAAMLPNNGQSPANLIYVDNLCRAILDMAAAPGSRTGFYNISDRESASWLDYYTGLAARLGYRSADVRVWPDAKLRLTPKHAFEWATQQVPIYKLMKWTLKKAGGGVKNFFKSRLQGVPEPPLPPGSRPPAAPKPSREHWVLFTAARRPPSTKLFRDFSGIQFVDFETALDRTAAWLRYAGYSQVTPER